MTSFEHVPLSPNRHAFRLLRLLKGGEDPIQCQLLESTLAIPEDVRDYEALSYAWGSASRPCEIKINGWKIKVTKNVYLALRDLRYQEEDRFLWIDALCIDQENKKERGQQVQRMGSIYSKAKQVIIWLGEATYDTDYIMQYMKQLEKESIKQASINQKITDEQWVSMWLAMVAYLSTDQRDLLVEGFLSLLHRNWFKRVWIIQETANARAAKIVCGGSSISANIFALMPSLLGITPDPHCQPILDIMPGHLRNISWWARKRDLYTMLVKFCKSEATDPRDNIYALLGISSDVCDTNLLKANYEKDLQDAIFDTTSFLLKFNKLDPPIYRFFSWKLPEFFKNLNILANEVLKCAVDNEQEALVKLLIVRDDVNVNINTSGQTPLSWAAKNGHEAVVKLLIESGKVDMGWKDIVGRTPLLQAAENGQETVVKLLIETGKVDVNSKDNYGRTPLSWAAGNGHEAVVKLLIGTSRVDVNLRDNYGLTPLGRAAQYGQEVIVKLLKEARHGLS